MMCCLQYDELEDSLRDSGALAQTQKTEHLEVRQIETKMKGRLRNVDKKCMQQWEVSFLFFNLESIAGDLCTV